MHKCFDFVKGPSQIRMMRTQCNIFNTLSIESSQYVNLFWNFLRLVKTRPAIADVALLSLEVSNIYST